MRYVIVGAGPAGVVAAETLRAQDPEGEVVLVRSEPGPAYSRMAIPYLLMNQIEESGTYLRQNPDHFENLGIRQIQDRVTSVDTKKQTVALAGGDDLEYGRLLLATGSSPVRPKVKGLDQEGVHHCWTLEDARNIIRFAAPGSHVVLMGAGFIGCIIMEALVKREVNLTVIEMTGRMVPRMMDQVAGGLIKRWCETKGIEVRTSTQARAVVPDDTGAARYRMECESSDSILADCIVVATGIRPSTDFLEGSGVEVHDGVVVDEHLQTSVPGVYAAGDVCECFDWSTGSRVLHGIQPVAAETGRVAAMNMAGNAVSYPGGLAMNVLEVLGLICTSYGQWMGTPNSEECHALDEGRFRYMNLQFEENRIIGAITLGVTEHIGVLRGLIQSRVRLGEWQQRLMNDPTRIMEAYLASTQISGMA